MGILWLAIIIIAILVDLFTSIFLFSGFSIGALIALVLNIFGVASHIQIIVFAVIGILFILIVSPKIKKNIAKNHKNRFKSNEERLIGKEFLAEQDIENEELVKLEGVYWTLKNEGALIKKGEIFKVISVKGNKIIIKK
ncbi:NfeD family protein [Clostridium massiliamazoniense]|uniref:NfeD family protein n=1 Tax=Clostridium massiliamazoniense TaxID=1347366 RepID=UPI0006D76BC6|nr:NfeD family protein [Clostridium massiliamazoniense]